MLSRFWRRWFPSATRRTCLRGASAPPRVECLENRLVPAAIVEVEANDTLAAANLVTIGTGDVLTTKPDNWLIVQGAIAAADSDYFQFTLSQRAGVFFDIDARDLDANNTLNSTIDVFDSLGVAVPNGSNNDGYDFQGFAVPINQTSGAVSVDSSLYLDLMPGTYYVRVMGSGGTTGNYQLRLLADANYATSVPALNSFAGAADTLYLDFNGHSATNDGWTRRDINSTLAGLQANGPYTATPFDFNGAAGEFSPAERLAIFNIWRVSAEDYAPFRINVSTAVPANFNNGVAFQMVITNSPESIIGFPGNTIRGVSFGNSYAGGATNNIAFTLSETFSTFADGGISGLIVARPVEVANTASHEFGHALGLVHFATAAGDVPGADVLPNALMSVTDTGLNRETWAIGFNESGNLQDDVAIISNTTNTFGYRSDDYRNTTTSPSSATPAANGFFNAGVIAPLADRDVFRFTASGATTITVDVDEYVNNLDVELRLFNSSGTQIAINDPSNSFDARIFMPNLAQGTYFADVRSDGEIGELGSYALTIDTVLTTVAVDANNNLVVTDIASGGKPDNIIVSRNGANIRIHDPSANMSAGNGAMLIDAHTVEVPIASVTGTTGINLNTLGGNDTFQIDLTGGNPLPASGLIFNAGSGTDTVLGHNANITWNLTGAGAGNLEGLGISFTGVENLTGNAARDIFHIASGSSLGGAIEGGEGTNWLDYSDYAGAITVNLAKGFASRLSRGVKNIDHVLGSSTGANRLTGSTAGNILVGKGRNNVLTGGAGRSLLIGGFGRNTLIGGATDDLLINGRTNYDADYSDLEAIFAIWQGADPYATRIATLQAAGPTQLQIGLTVFVYAAPNSGAGPRLGRGGFNYDSTLLGNGGDDWYFSISLRSIIDRAAIEVVTSS